MFGILNFDNLAKSLEIVMPDLIRHPERIKFTGLRPSPQLRKMEFFDFLRVHQFWSLLFVCSLGFVICDFPISSL